MDGRTKRCLCPIVWNGMEWNEMVDVVWNDISYMMGEERRAGEERRRRGKEELIIQFVIVRMGYLYSSRYLCVLFE